MTYSVYMESSLTTSLTFGRFNLPHPGHVDLVRKMLEVSDQAVVGVSTAATNNDIENRVKLFSLLCDRAGLPMDRITFMGASNPYRIVEEWIWDEDSGLTDLDVMLGTTLVLGVDQSRLGERISDDTGVRFVPNEVRVGSSTVIRYFLELGQEDIVREIYHNDDELFNLVVALREEELARENP